jgi:hypothetical protein
MTMFSFTGMKPRFVRKEMAVNTEKKKTTNPIPFFFITPKFDTRK